MPLSRRYTPEKPPDEIAIFGMSFEDVIPIGVGIASGTLNIFINTVPPLLANQDWAIGPVSVRGRMLYASLGLGIFGTDYLLRWIATDTDGNVWPRVGLVLVSNTS
jgi:hypothetical protein